MVIVATYLGQPDPIISLAGRFFGKKGQQLDPHGANLASASLPGGGFRTIHNIVQSLTQSMMKVAGIHSEKEAVKFLLGKVPDPWMTHYVDHISSSHTSARNSPHAIVPDILAHAHEYPAGRQRINDSGASCQVTHSLRLNPINQTTPDLITTTRIRNLPIAEPTKSLTSIAISSKGLTNNMLLAL
eukprot:scaffold42663_cov56-Cyclotella_meneghiniana.AAC.2